MGDKENKSGKYSAQLKEDAVAFAEANGTPSASEKFGIPIGTLGTWRTAYRKKVKQTHGKAVEEQPLKASVDAPVIAKPVKAKPVEEEDGKTSCKGKKSIARIYTPSQRQQALTMLEEKGPVETSRTLGISRFSLYEWKRRHDTSKQNSTVSSPIVSADINKASLRDDRILKEWKAHPGLGPSQIRNQLRRDSFKVSVRTVRMVMEENGYVTPKTRRVEVHNQRYESVRPNHLWHMDFVQRYIHKQRISVLLLIDDYSRFIPGFAMWDADRSEAVIECFESAVSRHGRPETVMSDGGAAFWAWNGVSRFTRLLEELGTDQVVAKVPQVNGKVEVLNGNVQKELFDKEQFCNLAQAHAQLESWVSFYNFQRTHQALGGLLVPADRYFGRDREVLAHIEAGSSPEGIGEPIRLGDRRLDLLRVSSQGGKVEVLLMGERIWPQVPIP
jgi:transposase InsO family protein